MLAQVVNTITPTNTMTFSELSIGQPAGAATVAVVTQGGARANTTVNSGNTLELQGSVTVIDEPLSINGVGKLIGPLSYVGATVLGTGALRSVSGDNAWVGTATGNLITLAGGAVYNVDDGATLKLAASVNVGGNATYKAGAGQLEITSPAGLNMGLHRHGPDLRQRRRGAVEQGRWRRRTRVQTLTALGLTDEQQRVTFGVTNPTAGSWSLMFQGQSTTLLPNNATADQVQAALANLAAVGGASKRRRAG